MNKIPIIGALAVAIAVTGCEDIENPVEEMGQFAPPYVVFTNTSGFGPHGTLNPVIFDVPPRPNEDVEIDFTFGGDAVFGEDYRIVNADGTPRTDVTAAGGTTVIPADPTAEQPHDTLWVEVLTIATVGRKVQVQITDARLASGGSVTVGRLGDLDIFSLTITAAPAEIPTGTYAGTISGDLGSGNLAIEITDDPVSIDGVEYRYQMSDFAAGAFGIPIPWGFNVLSDGSVSFSPNDTGGFEVTADITGEYDFDTNALSFDTTLTCCGGEGLQWSTEVTLQ